MRRMSKTRKMIKRILSLASWAKMMNLAGWWALSPNSTAPHGDYPANADEALLAPTTGMWARGRLLTWERHEALDNRNEGAYSCEAQTATTASTPSPTTFGKHMQILHIVPKQLLMPLVTSRLGSSQMRLGLEKPQSHKCIAFLLPDTVSD